MYRTPSSVRPGRASTSVARGRRPDRRKRLRIIAAAAASAAASFSALGAVAATAPVGAAPGPFLTHMQTVTNIASTIPGNGDVNPYGIVNVPVTTGALVRGDTLISNFNDSGNVQGTGTTIVEVSPSHHVTTFAQIASNLSGCTGGVGLTTALTVLNDGYVVVGSLPTESGGPMAGCLIVLDSNGVPRAEWTGNGMINGPWDMTAAPIPGGEELFVTNVLNGLSGVANDTEVDMGTVLRLDVATPPGQAPELVSTTEIGMGFAEENDTAALVIGPTGLALGPDDTLYVTDPVATITHPTRIASIPHASARSDAVTGTTVSSGGSLNGPLGLTLAPNGDLITVNAGDGNGVEVTPAGVQVATVQFDPAGAGGNLFGLTIAPNGRGVLFVDDGDNTLKLLH